MTSFRRVCGCAIALFAILLALPLPGGAQNWGSPVWSDEFTGPRGTPIDSSKWTYDTGVLKVNNEVEYYCAPSTVTGGCLTSNPNAYLDGNGNLIVQALRLNNSTAPNSGSWTSARLITQGLESFQYGRAESRMSLPVGPGIWPAFWALGSDITTAGWPGCGEIDYMENVPLSPGGLGPSVIASTLHGSSSSERDFSLGAKYSFPVGSGVTTMHNYGAIWSPGMVQFYVDDPSRVFFVGTASDMKSGQTWAFDHPFFLLLNLAIGGDGSWPGPPDATTPSPALMTVDYVRIYKAATVQAPTFGNPPSITVKAGAMSGNSSSFSINDAAGSGRVYVTCSTNATRSTCQLTTTDSLNMNTVDFTNATSSSVTVSVATTANAVALPLGAWRLSNWRTTAFLLLVFAVCTLLLVWHRTGVLRAAAIGVGVCAAILLGCSGGAGSTTPPATGGGTTPGTYNIIVNAYTVSAAGTKPDAMVSIPLTVN